MTDQKKILIIAGEASGDQHGADLLKSLRPLLPNARFYGIGGDLMKAHGVELFYHLRQMAFLGFVEVVKHLPFILRVFKKLKLWMMENKPAAVVLIDYPGFNLRLAKIAKSLNIPVVYYICPQLWAWGEKRVEKIRKFVDLPMVIFKFEEDFYRRHNIPAKFVGHPLVDEISISLSETDFRKKHDLSESKPLVALLPGSRANEVKGLLPEMKKVIERWGESGKYEWVIGKAEVLPEELFHDLSPAGIRPKLVRGDSHHLMKYATVVLLASGTATLETAFLATPMIVLYRVSALTYQIGRRLIRIKNIALANIVSGEQVVPELIQHDVTAENIIRELDRLLSVPEHYRGVVEKLRKVAQLLGGGGASQRAASLIQKLLNDGAHQESKPARE